LTAVMYAFLPRILSAFTTSPEVLAALSTITGYVVFSQVISSVAFVLDGMVYAYGPTGFRYAASTMLFSAAGAISTMWIAANAIGLPPLAAGWAGLVALMIGRAGTMLCFFLPALRTNTN
jgi:Na+-driven multidrug efflux pump